MSLAKSLRLCLIVELLIRLDLLIDFGLMREVVREGSVNLGLIQMGIVTQQVINRIAFVDEPNRNILYAHCRPGDDRASASYFRVGDNQVN